jgi:DNA-binding NarL/FixJ family response regulator
MRMTLTLVEDDVLFRESLSSALSRRFPDWKVRGMSSDEARSCRLSSDVVLTGVDGRKFDLLGSDGSSDTSEMFHELDMSKTSACTASSVSPISTGVDGMEALFRAIAGISDQSVALSEDANLRQVDVGSLSARDMLTPREMDVLEELRKGNPNKQIAYDLDLSISTIKVHLRNIMRKLHASNRTQVIIIDEANRSARTSEMRSRSFGAYREAAVHAAAQA